MVAVGDPLERMRQTVAKRLRWFTVYHAVLAAVAVVAIGWIVLPSGVSDLLWVFVYVAVIMPAGVPVVWWLNRRGFRRSMASLEAFRPRISDAKVSLRAGYLLILDSGIVLGVDPRSNAIRFVGFFSAGGALLHPDLVQAERWGSRIRGLQTEGAISNKKGPPEAQAELDRFRVAFGAKWYLFFLRQMKVDRMAAGDPMWHEVLAFFIPKWWDHARAIAGELDGLVGFLEGARTKYFPRGGAPT